MEEIRVVAFVMAVVLLASTAHSVTGFGFALIVVPFFVTVLDVRDAVALATMLALTTVVLLVPRVRGDVPGRTVIAMIAGSLAGMPLGLMVLLLAPSEALALAIGVATMVMATLLARGVRVPEGGVTGALTAGMVSGVLRTSTSLDGPPVVLYLQGSGHPPEQFRAALTVFFLVGGVLAVATFAASGVISARALALAAAGVPSVYAGSLIGRALHARVDAAAFRRLVFVVLMATAVSAIASAARRLAV